MGWHTCIQRCYPVRLCHVVSHLKKNQELYFLIIYSLFNIPVWWTLLSESVWTSFWYTRRACAIDKFMPWQDTFWPCGWLQSDGNFLRHDSGLDLYRGHRGQWPHALPTWPQCPLKKYTCCGQLGQRALLYLPLHPVMTIIHHGHCVEDPCIQTPFNKRRGEKYTSF